MAAVIIIFKIYTGKSDDYASVDATFKAIGTVASVDKSYNKYTVTMIDTEILNGTSVASDEKILLYIKSESQSIKKYNYSSTENVIKTGNEIKIGNVIEVSGTAEAFERPGNPGQFNAYKYYLEKGYAYKVFADRYSIVDGSCSYREYLRKASDYCIGIFERYLPENEAGILSAMMFGRKSLLMDDDREMYKVNGLMHILAVSGMHIETVSLIFLFIITKLPVSFRAGRISLFAMLVIYGIITGFGVSCIRAVIMCGLKIMAELAGRTYDVISALSFAAIITLFINPRNLFQCDFILSYLAVTAIAVVYPIMEGGLLSGMENNRFVFLKKLFIKPLLFGICVNITTMPVILYFYYDAALYSVLISLIILPLISVLFVTGCLCAIFGGVVPAAGMFLAGSIHFILSFYGKICEWCVDNVYDMRITGYPGAARIMLCYIIISVILYLVYRIKNRRACIFFCFLFFALPICVLNYRDTGNLKITFMDVGQGDGVVIRIPGGKTVCIDGGSSDISGLAKYRIEPYLNYEGIKHIDYWIITHMDNDHYSGLKEILERHRYNGITVDNIVIADTQICRDEFSAEFSGPAGEMADEIADGKINEAISETISEAINETINETVNVLYMHNNLSLVSGGVIMRCLNPDASYEYGNQNESSVVLELSYGEFDALFTGDVEGGPERMLHIDRDKQYEVLKVAHHGSKNSTCDEFLNKFNCSNAVISYGRDNRYGHPHAETTDALSRYGYNIYKTAEGGAVTVSVDESGYVIEQFYQQ